MSGVATLLLTRPVPPDPWPGMTLSRCNIFLLDQATRLVDHPFAPWPAGQRIYCAYSLHRLSLPPPVAGPFAPGGLANLGEMLWESERILCNHHLSPPLATGHKKFLVPLPSEADRCLESLRMACGLAGCGHRIVLPGVAEFSLLADQLPAAREYVAALAAMGARGQWEESWEMVLEL